MEELKKGWLLYYKTIGVKLIFSRYTSLDLNNYSKFEIALTINKNIENKEEDEKTKAK